MEEASAKDLWTVNRYLKEPVGDGGKSHIPTLRAKDNNGIVRVATMNKGKAEVLHKVFFPPKPMESTVPVGYQYPVPLPPPDIISKDQIRRHVRALSLYKASGPDGIPNIVLQKAIDIIKDYLDYIY